MNQVQWDNHSHKKGYEITKDKEEKADIYIINTCSVTNIAERKSRQMIYTKGIIINLY